MNYTPNLDLAQFESTDKPKWLVQYNDAMQKIDDFSGREDERQVKTTASFAAMEVRFADDEAKIEDHENRIDALETGQGSVDASLKVMQHNIDTIHHEAVTNAQGVAVNRQHIDEVTTRLTEAEKEIVDAQDDIAHQDQVLGALREDVNRFGAVATKNQTDIQNMKSTFNGNLYISDSGDDNNSGLDTEHPFRTFSKLNRFLNSNDTIKNINDIVINSVGLSTIDESVNTKFAITMHGNFVITKSVTIRSSNTVYYRDVDFTINDNAIMYSHSTSLEIQGNLTLNTVGSGLLSIYGATLLFVSGDSTLTINGNISLDCCSLVITIATIANNIYQIVNSIVSGHKNDFTKIDNSRFINSVFLELGAYNL